MVICDGLSAVWRKLTRILGASFGELNETFFEFVGRYSRDPRRPFTRLGHVIAASRGGAAARLYGLNTQHDPWRASALARRTGGDDNSLLTAL